MATHPGMLLAYDTAGSVIATLDYMVLYDDTPERAPVGLVDFATHEELGGEMLEVWAVDSGNPTLPAKGSKVWPEYLGSRAQDFRVELTGPAGGKHVSALVHKMSGHRRERAVLDATIASRLAAAAGQPADIRDVVGGPDRPLNLDASGRSVARIVRTQSRLPMAVV